jgi:hypothetical protein
MKKLVFKCLADGPIFAKNDKRYLNVILGAADLLNVRETQAVLLPGASKVVSSLEGSVLTLKVPYRYNRITCKVLGNKTLHELVQGDSITTNVEYCGVWNVNDFCGHSWKLVSLTCQ